METISYLLIDLENSTCSTLNSEIEYPYADNLWLKYKKEDDEFDINNPLVITKGYVQGQSLLGNSSIYFTTFDKEKNQLTTTVLNDSTSSKFCSFKTQALVFISRCRIPSIINIEETNINFLPSPFSIMQNYKQLSLSLNGKNIGLICNSPLASATNRFAVLSSKETDFGSFGLSQVFYNKNIKGLTLTSDQNIVPFSKEVNSEIKKKFKNSSFLDTSYKESSLFIIKKMNDNKILGIETNKKGSDPRTYHLNANEASGYLSQFKSENLKRMCLTYQIINNLCDINNIYDLLNVSTSIDNYEFLLSDQILSKCRDLGLTTSIIPCLYSLNDIDTSFNYLRPITKENIVDKLEKFSKDRNNFLNLYQELLKNDNSILVNKKVALPVDIRKAYMTCISQISNICFSSFYEIYISDHRLNEEEASFFSYVEIYLNTLFSILGLNPVLMVPLVYENMKKTKLLKYNFYRKKLLKNKNKLRKFLKLNLFDLLIKTLGKENYDIEKLIDKKIKLQESVNYKAITSPYRYSTLVSCEEDKVDLISPKKIKQEYRKAFNLSYDDKLLK